MITGQTILMIFNIHNLSLRYAHVEMENLKTLHNFTYFGKNTIGQHILKCRSLANLGQDIFMEFIDRSYLLSLNNQDRSQYNTSKLEMVLCYILANIHTEICGTKSFKSVISNDGSQLKISKTNYSLDGFCSDCGTGYLVEGKECDII